MDNILHISNSSYPSLEAMGPSRAIYDELAKGVDEYHVLAQNVVRRFARFADGNLTLHLTPAVSAREFIAWSYDAVPLTRRHGIRAIVCQDPLFGGPAALATRRPCLAECHTDVYFAFARSGNPLKRSLGNIALRVLRKATRVRITGDHIAATLEAHGVRRDRMVFVPYRVDTDFFAPQTRGATDEPLVVSVGRFVEQKGYGKLIEAFAHVVAEVPEARLVLAGGGPLESSYREAIERLGLGGHVTLRQWVTREEQRDLLAAAAVYAQPSLPGLGEWSPRTILEAMAMGVPIVASRVGGIPDVVRDGENGRLVGAGDLAGALTRLIADGDLRARLGGRARQDAVEQYSWARSFELYREAISELSA